MFINNVQFGFQCTCNGTTKRRVLCFDRALKKPASNCDERRKPPTKEHCKMPDNCSCKSIQEQRNVRQNGNYILNIRGKPVEIHCHDMNTEQPKEYIRLPAGENYAIYYDKRSSDKNRCPRTEADTYKDYSLPSGVTHFKKVRLDLHRLVVIEDDYQFVRWSGTRIQSFGSAGDCFSLDQACPRGRFSVNFEGTRFHIRTDSTWDRSPNATITYEKRVIWANLLDRSCIYDESLIICSLNHLSKQCQPFAVATAEPAIRTKTLVSNLRSTINRRLSNNASKHCHPGHD